MQQKASLKDLEETLKRMLNEASTTVSFDSSGIRAPVVLNIENVLRHIKWGQHLDGYNVTSIMTKHKMYNQETANVADLINATNQDYFPLLLRMLKKNENLVIPATVIDEQKQWIDGTDFDGYEKWTKGKDKPFESETLNYLVETWGNDPYFAQIFQVQFKYKFLLKNFLTKIPEERIAKNYDQNTLNALEPLDIRDCHQQDKVIFCESLDKVISQSNRNLNLISFDSGHIRAASFADENSIAPNINKTVHKGYSFARCENTGESIVIKYPIVYPHSG